MNENVVYFCDCFLLHILKQTRYVFRGWKNKIETKLCVHCRRDRLKNKIPIGKFQRLKFVLVFNGSVCGTARIGEIIDAFGCVKVVNDITDIWYCGHLILLPLSILSSPKMCLRTRPSECANFNCDLIQCEI